jgi:nucleoside-diphosphate-sugar epimerase
VLAEKSNLVTTRNVIRFKKKNTPILFSSTISNYGPQTSPVNEDSPANPNSIYGKTKKAAEDLVLAERNNIVFRFSGAFGVSPKMRHDNLIHDFVLQSLSGTPLSVYESHFIRQFVHVKDMADSILFAIRNWEKMQGNIFNIGNPKIELTKRQLVERIAKHHSFEFRFENSGKDLEKRDYPISFKKILEYGFSPRIDLDEGIIELLGFYDTEQLKESANGR